MQRTFTACVMFFLSLPVFADENYFDSAGRDDVLSGGVKMMPIARALELPDGSHLSMYDDQQRYMDGVMRFIRDVDSGSED